MVSLIINSDIIKNVRLAIFDKDGTLMDLYTYWSNMVAYRVELAHKKLGFDECYKKNIMYEMGVDLDRGILKQEGPVGLKKREIVMRSMIDALAKIGFPDTQNICFEVFREADQLSINYLSEIIKPINGMNELINTLHAKNCRIAIATTDKTERAKLATEFLGISDKVDVVVGEDMVKNYKPFPDMINLILRELDIDKKNAVIAGDAITDIEMGINAELLASIGVCSGLTSREKLLDKTRYIVEDISHIKVL